MSSLGGASLEAQPQVDGSCSLAESRYDVPSSPNVLNSVIRLSDPAVAQSINVESLRARLPSISKLPRGGLLATAGGATATAKLASNPRTMLEAPARRKTRANLDLD